MNKLILASTAVGMLALTACDGSKCDSGGCPDSAGGESGITGDSGNPYYTGATYITEAGGDCKDGAKEALWWYDIYTVGLASSADLYIYQTGSTSPWDEYHPVDVYSSDDYGWETNLYIELGIVSSTGDVVSGSTTLFQCNDARYNSLTWLVDVFDDTNTYADCVTWGHDTSFYSHVCTNAI